MDRPIIYTGEIPRSTDVLNGWQQAMIGLGHFIKMVLGTNTWVEGLACTPQNPASLSVNVGAGQIYALDEVDASGYGSLAANTLTIMKQGLLTGTTALSCPAPSTAGDSINYLIEAAYIDQDADPVVLPYYNAANPSQALSGAGNNGAPQNTIRQGVCNLVVKAGAAAATGSQTTPAPDTGYVGLWVVTVAAGATTITATNIAAYPDAPFWSGAPGLNQPNIFTDTQTIDLPAGFSGKALIAMLNGSTTFYVDQAGNLLTIGTLTYKPYVITPTASQTLPNNQKVICQTGALTANITLTTGSPPVGGEAIIYGSASAYTVTVSTGVTSGSPYFQFPDGSQVYSYVIPASSPGAGIRLDFDGTNYRATTFGPTIVAPATAANEAVNLSQVANACAPVAANANGNAATGAATTAVLTAPCDGWAIVVASFSSADGSLNGTGVTASLAGIVAVMNSNDGNYFNQSVWYLPMKAGQGSNFTGNLSQITVGAFTVTVIATFQPNPGT